MCFRKCSRDGICVPGPPHTLFSRHHVCPGDHPPGCQQASVVQSHSNAPSSGHTHVDLRQPPVTQRLPNLTAQPVQQGALKPSRGLELTLTNQIRSSGHDIFAKVLISRLFSGASRVGGCCFGAVVLTWNL